jgi:prepilin-type N-terminal cleavage/methylation domain-containing protein
MNFTSPRRIGQRYGFSVIEIIVVVAILALLSALLFPALKEQIRKTRQATLVLNMKKIAGGVIAYANDTDGRLPAAHQPAGSWQKVVMPYIGEDGWVGFPEKYKKSAFHDPLDTEEFPYNNTKRASLNIALNGMVSVNDLNSPPLPAGAAYRLLTSISQPSRLLLMTTGERNLDAYSGYTMRVNSNAFRGNADTAKLTRITGHHMCGFVDGHVELIPLVDILKEVDKDRSSISTSVFFDNRGNNGQGPN